MTIPDAKLKYYQARTQSEEAWRLHCKNVGKWIEQGDYTMLHESERQCVRLDNQVSVAWDELNSAYVLESA